LGQVDPEAISSRAGFDSSRAIVESRTAWAVPAAEELAVLFLRANIERHLLVFLLASVAIGDKNYFKFNWLWY
jgi:hypothetical protein